MKKRLQKKTFVKNVLVWYDKHGRKNLPWQNQEPYCVWLSEIMLQQTQVKTVIPYFLTFMDHFPTIESLAHAKLDCVLSLWSGLGYYARARNLHQCAKKIVDEYAGKFPQTVSELCDLPGIGRSTAGAILALGFKKQASILDGNVKRVLCRAAGIEGWYGQSDVQKKLWSLAESLTPSARVADYTQAMMDLGATLCTRTKPDCMHCPLARSCYAKLNNLVAVYPSKKPKKILPEKQRRFLLIKHHSQVLLIKRPAQGLWGGLWSLPECELNDDVVSWCRMNLGLAVSIEDTLPVLTHTFSHFRLQMHPQMLQCEGLMTVMDSDQFFWYNLEQMQAIGTAKPINVLLENAYNDATNTL